MMAVRDEHYLCKGGIWMANGPDCESCIHVKACVFAAFGKFCPMWQSREPQPEGEDPNEAWRRGDDIEP